MRVAALTMVYNEPVFAPIWARHYARQVGAENCLVLDHGSSDGSTAGLGVAVERVRRTTLDEEARAVLVSDCVGALLRRYDAVVHTDADELLVADPERYADLVACAGALGGVTTAVGLDLQHLPDEEGALEAGRRVGAQRGWVRFSGAMCKPAVVREAVRWTPGFHGLVGGDGVGRRRSIGPLYLVHLRYADLETGLARLARSRGVAFARADTNPHQRVPDSEFEGMVRAIGRLPREAGSLALDGALLAPWLERMQAGWMAGDGQLGLAGDALWALPMALRAVL